MISFKEFLAEMPYLNKLDKPDYHKEEFKKFHKHIQKNWDKKKSLGDGHYSIPYKDDRTVYFHTSKKTLGHRIHSLSVISDNNKIHLTYKHAGGSSDNIEKSILHHASEHGSVISGHIQSYGARKFWKRMIRTYGGDYNFSSSDNRSSAKRPIDHKGNLDYLWHRDHTPDKDHRIHIEPKK